MNSGRRLVVVRTLIAATALAGIVLVYRHGIHVNTTTVALSFLLLVLLIAAEWGLRYALLTSIAAAACYNFFFLPPYDTFTIADTQNWVALFVFLATSIIASRLSHRARSRTLAARAHQRELDALFRLSRELLLTQDLPALLPSLPATLCRLTQSPSAYLYLIEGGRLYQAGQPLVSAVEFPHLNQLAETLTSTQRDGLDLLVPLRSGVRPRGLLCLHLPALTPESADAAGGLISLALDRAQALDRLALDTAAKESERLRALMIDSITHELRTPLTAIKGAATTLIAGHLSQAAASDLLSIIDEETDRLNHLVSEATEMARLETHQVQMRLKSVPVRSLIDEALSICPAARAAHPIAIRVESNVSAAVDPAFFLKLLCNLIDNAARYSNPDSPITISAASDSEEVTISVADQGSGIDAAEQTLVFDRLYRGASNPRASSGTGMGLAISRAIAEAHGGHISLTSQLNRGSVFTVHLPAIEERPVSHAAARRSDDL